MPLQTGVIASSDVELLTRMRAAYLAFDLFPSAKGASTHISHMARYLFDFYQGGALMTLGNKQFAGFDVEGNICSVRFTQQIENYLQRANAYSEFVFEILSKMPSIEALHFRDIWSGLAAFAAKPSAAKVFEVNGLASIELPYRYPQIAKSTLAKLEDIELHCLQRATEIVVPSSVIANKVEALGVSSDAIHVVRNAAEEKPDFANIDTSELGDYLIYFGASQPWQGLESLIRAFALLRDHSNLTLLICSSVKPRQVKPLKKLVRNLDLEPSVVWKHQLTKPELNSYIQGAMLSIAPLTACSRNLEQGCSPLKIFESMACGTAIVASRLPVVEEILTDGMTAKLVPPDRPSELARAIRVLLEYPELRKQLGLAAKQAQIERFTWGEVKHKMLNIYASL